MAARFAPYDKPNLGRGGTAERHRRAGLRFHRRFLAVARGGA
jgi:hypothetical protein